MMGQSVPIDLQFSELSQGADLPEKGTTPPLLQFLFSTFLRIPVAFLINFPSLRACYGFRAFLEHCIVLERFRRILYPEPHELFKKGLSENPSQRWDQATLRLQLKGFEATKGKKGKRENRREGSKKLNKSQKEERNKKCSKEMQ